MNKGHFISKKALRGFKWTLQQILKIAVGTVGTSKSKPEVLRASEVGDNLPNCTSKENMRLLLTHKV